MPDNRKIKIFVSALECFRLLSCIYLIYITSKINYFLEKLKNS